MLNKVYKKRLLPKTSVLRVVENANEVLEILNNVY